MRNLKRALSLALASVMLVGMMVVGTSAASFPDVTSEDHVEAIEVLNAVEVMIGDNGDFRPDDSVTRNEMAVIMAKLILGKDADSYVGTHPFTDVPEWADKYVAACYNEGIVAGMTETTYVGSETVTAEQAAAMMLRALGYQKLEGTGANWAQPVVAKANNISLFKDVGANPKAAMTRNAVAQLALNTLKADVVESDIDQDIIVEGVVTIPGKVTYNKVPADPANGDANYNSAASTADSYKTQQLCEKLYGKDLALASNAQDEFDRPANQWKYKNKEVATSTKGADATYTAEVKLGEIYKDLGQTGSSTFTYYVDGATSTTNPYNHGTVTGSSDSNKIGGKGVLVEAYATGSSSNTVSVYVTNTFAGKVTAVRAATSSKEASVTITPLSTGAKGGTYETTAFAKDDIVLYNYSNKSGDTGVKNVALAEQVTGVLNGYNTGKSVTVDGQVYEFSKSVAAPTLNTGMTKKEVTLTLDQNGYVLDLDADGSDDTEYAIVLRYQDEDDFNKAKAELWFTDNTTKVVELTADVDKQAGGDNVEKGAIVSYTTNDKDEYTLTAVADPDADGSGTTPNTALTTKGSGTIAVKTDTTSIGSSGTVTAANGKTIFMVATKSGDDTVYNVYTGIANVPTIKTKGSTGQPTNAYIKTGESAAAVVYIDATDDTKVASEGGSSKDVIFVLGDDSAARYDTDKGTYYVYKAIVNGEIVEDFETATQVTAFTLYTSSSTNSKDMTTLSSSVNYGTGTDEEANGSIGLAAADGSTVAWLTYAEDCEVFYIDEDDNVSVSSIDSIKKDVTDKVWYKTTDDEVTTIVIQEVNSSTKTFKVQAKCDGGTKGASATAVTGETTAVNLSDVDVTVAADKTVTLVVSDVAAGAKVTVSPSTPKTLVVGTVAYEFEVTVVAENGDTLTSTVTVTFKSVAAGG